MALLPIISPPFALALATILLFGRSGLISRGLFHYENNVYGLSGLAFVQLITFFPVAFLLFEGMLRALDPSIEEAALNLGATRWRVFWTVTLPLLVPGIAGSVLLLFIESLADLGNPILIGGDFNVLAVQSWLAIVGQGNFQLGAVLSTVLLLPSVAVFMLQRYWVSRRSYVSVTGKPTGGVGIGVGRSARVGLVAFCLALAFLVTCSTARCSPAPSCAPGAQITASPVSTSSPSLRAARRQCATRRCWRRWPRRWPPGWGWWWPTSPSANASPDARRSTSWPCSVPPFQAPSSASATSSPSTSRRWC